MTSLILNVAVSVLLTVILRTAKAPAGVDETQPDDFYSDVAFPEVIAAERAALAAREGQSAL